MTNYILHHPRPCSCEAYEHAYATETRRIENANSTLAGVEFVFLLLCNHGFPTENYPAMTRGRRRIEPPRRTPTSAIIKNQDMALRATNLINDVACSLSPRAARKLCVSSEG
jgi:hypothetical protein